MRATPRPPRPCASFPRCFTAWVWLSLVTSASAAWLTSAMAPQPSALRRHRTSASPPTRSSSAR
eukprot:2440307-Alexandrium_andersonii.AAC.1